MKIRHAQPADAAAIAAIYNHYVLHSTATYQEEPDTVEQRTAWLTDRLPEHPVIVGEENGQIIGWAALSPFKARSAYRYTAENSIYLKHGHTGKGLGKELLSHLIALADSLGLRCLVAVVSADQTASIGIHESLGFKKCGQLQRIGIKFGTWLDVTLLQKNLGD
jgi:L-amino acid N-acyltransferase